MAQKSVNKRAAQPNRAQAIKRRRAEEEDDDLDGFIADGDDSGDWKRELRKITRYDASRYKHIDDRDDPSMEVGWQRCQLEEHRSARSGESNLHFCSKAVQVHHQTCAYVNSVQTTFLRSCFAIRTIWKPVLLVLMPSTSIWLCLTDSY